MPGRISRRSAVSLMGAGGLAGVLVGQAASERAAEPVAASALPLQVGQRFGRWTISAIYAITDGALQIGIEGADSREFVLELMARDPSPLAPRPPASTDALAIFVRNGGDGWLPTAEEQGLAAMTLARVLESSGHVGPVAGLLTHSERVVQHRATLQGDWRDA